MSTRLSTQRLSAAGLLAALLALTLGCGGGSGSRAASAPSALTGVFVDSPVAGARYRTETQAGITNASGEFTYLAGERVTFYVGDFELGSTPAAAEVTVFDLAGVATLPGSTRELWAISDNETDAVPMHTAINLAVLLQTLDADSVPENGIEILPAVAALFSEGAITLNQPYWRFQTNHRLRQILKAADAEALMTSRSLVPAARALNHLFEQVGHDVTTAYARRTEFNTDGLPGAERIITSTYNAEGQITGSFQDENGDGNVDSSTGLVYDSMARQVTYTWDSDGDGSPNQTRLYTYNAFGERTLDESLDANDQVTRSDRNTYDDQGVLVHRLYQDANGTREYRWFTDGNGTRTAMEFDLDGDGAWERRDEFVYDDQDRWIEREVDRGNDGSIDEYVTREWDAMGKLVSEQHDQDMDEVIDRSQIWRYNANSQLLEYIVSTPSDPSSTAARHLTKTYDAEGRQLTDTWDFGDDDVIDQHIEWAYTTDTEGHLFTETRYDLNGDTVFERIVTVERDENERLVEQIEQRNLDTQTPLVTTTTYAYDDQGRPIGYTRGGTVVERSDWIEVPLGFAL